MVKVKTGPQGPLWEIEDLGSGARETFPTPNEMLEFMQAHLARQREHSPPRRSGGPL